MCHEEQSLQQSNRLPIIVANLSENYLRTREGLLQAADQPFYFYFRQLVRDGNIDSRRGSPRMAE